MHMRATQFVVDPQAAQHAADAGATQRAQPRTLLPQRRRRPAALGKSVQVGGASDQIEQLRLRGGGIRQPRGKKRGGDPGPVASAGPRSLPAGTAPTSHRRYPDRAVATTHGARPHAATSPRRSSAARPRVRADRARDSAWRGAPRSALLREITTTCDAYWPPLHDDPTDGRRAELVPPSHRIISATSINPWLRSRSLSEAENEDGVPATSEKV